MNAHRIRLDPTTIAAAPGKQAAATVHITNLGDVVDAVDAPTTARLSGSDAEQALDLEFAPAAVSVRPGGTAIATLRARCRNLAFAGEARQWSFKVAVDAEDTAAVELPGVLMQRPLLGRAT